MSAFMALSLLNSIFEQTALHSTSLHASQYLGVQNATCVVISSLETLDLLFTGQDPLLVAMQCQTYK